MLAILSPAKNINFSKQELTKEYSLPVFTEEASLIMDKLKGFSKSDISILMNIKGKLLEQNFERIHSWGKVESLNQGKQAILSYSGEVFNGLDAISLDEEDLIYSKSRLKILSGLYGALNPLDLIMPYRLEMQTNLMVEGYKNLYYFWGEKIKNLLEEELDSHVDKTLVNLASNEYSKAVYPGNFKHKVLNIHFKDYRKGDSQPKVITIYAKKARGMMMRFILKNRIESNNDLKAFSDMGYMFDDKLSNSNNYVFIR